MNNKQILKSLAKFYGIRLFIKKKWNDHATTDLVSDEMYILYNNNIRLEFLLSSFFHELAHLKCKYENKFPLFHEPYLDKMPKNKRPYFLATMYRAEQYADSYGEKLMKVHFPMLKFVKGYTKSKKKDFLPIMRQTFKQYFKELDEMKKSKRNN